FRCGIAERRGSGPVIGNLWFDNNLVLVVSRAFEAILQQTMPGQSPDQYVNLLVDVPATGRKRGEWQTNAQFLCASRRARAERSQIDRMATEASDDMSACVRLERDMAVEPGGNRWRCSPSPFLCFGSAQAGSDPHVWG